MTDRVWIRVGDVWIWLDLSDDPYGVAEITLVRAVGVVQRPPGLEIVGYPYDKRPFRLLPSGEKYLADTRHRGFGIACQGADGQLLPALSPAHLDLDFDKRFGAERVGAYERLLLDVIHGRLNLFVRSDEQQAAWTWVEPLLAHWHADTQGPRPYAAGSWGPSAASAMIARDGHCWSEEA